MREGEILEQPERIRSRKNYSEVLRNPYQDLRKPSLQALSL